MDMESQRVPVYPLLQLPVDPVRICQSSQMTLGNQRSSRWPAHSRISTRTIDILLVYQPNESNVVSLDHPQSEQVQSPD